jgi:hypothetical protein
LVFVNGLTFNLLKRTDQFLADSRIELINDKAATVEYSIKIKLNLDDDFMRAVEADIRRLDSSGALTTVSGDIDSAAALVQAGSSALANVGTCVKPLGEALKAFVKVMNGIADVRSSLHNVELRHSRELDFVRCTRSSKSLGQFYLPYTRYFLPQNVWVSPSQ